MYLDDLVHDLGGFARRATLLDHGTPVRALAAAVHRGRLTRPRRGLYCHPSISLAQQHAAAHGGALTCGAALAENGVWLRDKPAECIVLLEQGHERRRDGCLRSPTTHRRREAPRFGRDSAAEALAHYLQCAPDDEARACAVESCLARGLVSSDELNFLADRSSARLQKLLSWCGPHAGSGLETIVRRRLTDHGIDALSQVRLPGVGSVDLLIGDRLVVELDGREHHARTANFHRDRVRDARTALLGGVTLRFSAAQVLREPVTVIEAIRASMTQGAHLSGSRFRMPGATRWD